MIAEPDVALTDYGLALECALFVGLLRRPSLQGGPLKSWFVVFFVSATMAPALGGTVHGFFNDESNPVYGVLWPATLIAVGGVPLAAWFIGAHVLKLGPSRRWIGAGATVFFVAYVGVVLWVSDTFLVAVVHYVPAAGFLAVALLIQYARARESWILTGVSGVVILFLGAGVQQSGITLHPVYMSANALYHVIQAVAFLLLFLYARRACLRAQPLQADVPKTDSVPS